MNRRVLFRSQALAAVVGLGLIGAGMYTLYDAWEGRGEDTPWYLRWLTVF